MRTRVLSLAVATLFTSVALETRALADPVGVREKFIVDTGPADPGPLGWLVGHQFGDETSDAVQSLYAQFAIDRAVTISQIQGWMDVQSSGSVAFSVYTNQAQHPGSSLFATTATFLSRHPPDNNNDPLAEWLGTGRLSWFLQPGSYWVGYEAVQGSPFFAGMPPGAQTTRIRRMDL
jgi:hypothetical protein